MYHTTKICPKCKIEKPLSDFGANKARKDKLQSYCKLCRKDYSMAWIKSNPIKAKITQKRYRQKNKDKVRETQERYKENNPEKTKARAYGASLLRKGNIKRKNICEICNKKTKTHLHHPNYLQGWYVRELCPSCHRGVHSGRIKLEEDENCLSTSQ